MELNRRLAALGRQTGRQPAPPSGDLAERIRRLRPGAVAAPVAAKPCDEQALADLSGGRLIEPGLILVESRIGLDRRHGARPLAWLADPVTALPEAEGLDSRRLVFFDTETSGLAGGTGTQVFLLGLARVQGQALVLHQYLLTRFAGEPALLRRAGAWLAGASGLVSYNGRSFDAPLLATRARLAGVDDALAGLKHLDLLHPLRRAFARHWTDCRLVSAEQRLLGFQRRDDLPGSEAPRAWFEWLHQGEARLLPRVLQHNRWDLISLAQLLPLLDRVYSAPFEWDADVESIARGRLRAGRDAAALELLQASSVDLAPSGLLLLASLLKRHRRWEAAGSIWRRLVVFGNAQASEQLAKYHEHVTRQYAQALVFADQLPPGLERERRCRRLQRKLGGPNTRLQMPPPVASEGD